MRTILFFLFAAIAVQSQAQDTLQLKNVDVILYTGNGGEQPLVVGLGGSEGGNAWASRHWEKTRNEFISRGYAFLAIGYFNTPHSPELLNKIAIEDIHNAIAAARKNKKVNNLKTAVIGGSRGADLALLLASYYNDINCVIGLSASHAVFPGHTDHFSTSTFTWAGKELPFVPVNDAAVPFMMKRDLRGAFEAMLQDTAAEKKAMIPVEKIKGTVLLLSGTKDEICPSSVMCEKMIDRLKRNQFKYHYEHIAYEGGHAEPLKHFDTVFAFLNKYF